jgi:dolichol-phosphate mannosyltransferase
MLLADKLVGRYVPVRFVAFTLVGGVGVLIHLVVVALLLNGVGLDFAVSQATGSVVAMISNYSINNVLTYRDRRRRGLRWLTGLASFVAACGVGALANVGVASYLFEHRTRWILAALAGILVGAVWNYAVTRRYTWGGRRR